MQTICSDTQIDIEKPFKISAGPGAGKTRFLINHIKNVLSNSNRLNAANKIACITYTNIAVEEIKTRLEDKSERVDVSTIHSFLYRNLVKPYAYLAKDNENNPIIIDMKELDGHEEHQPSYTIIQEWLNACSGNNAYLYKDKNKLSILRKLLSSLKYNLTEEEINLNFSRDMISEKLSIMFPSQRIQSEDFLNYKKMYWKKGIIDHEDVLYLSYQLLKQNPNLVDFVRCKYPYMFIDEFQDTNPIQTEIVKMLASSKCIIGVIGDYNQSIYGFQGAKPEDFRDFSVEGLSEYNITDNWRSTKKIINILNKFIDTPQECKRNVEGAIPSIVVGNIQNAISFIKEKEANYTGQNFTSVILTKDNKDLCRIKASLNFQTQYSENLWSIFKDKEGSSGKCRFFTIQQVLMSYQQAKDKKFELALNEILKLFKKEPFNTINDKLKQRAISLEILEFFINYDSISERTIKEFYILLKAKLSAFGIRLSDYRAGQAANFAEEHSVGDMLEHLKITEYKTEASTIHGAKGTEYNMVSLFIFDDGHNKAENKLKTFINAANMQNERHRIKFVALSRAQDYLYIVVPELTEENEQIIKSTQLYKIERI